jgi:hypothetical protein
MPLMDDLNNTKLRFSSYDCRGYYDSKAPYIIRLLLSCEFVFIQEHWLAKSQLHVLSNLCSTHISHGSRGFNNNFILRGHPYGGCAILWRADIKAQVLFVETNNSRTCCVRVHYDTNKLLLINVYMPYECNAAAADELSSVLADVIAIID